MTEIETILAALDERHISREIGLRHDNARNSFRLDKNTTSDFEEFGGILGDYYNQHIQSVYGCGPFAKSDAISRVKQLVDQIYHREGGDFVSAFNDCVDSMNGGIRVVIDRIVEMLKAENVEHHIREIFDTHVAPHSWEMKVEIIKQFIAKYGDVLSSSINRDQPERYAQNYQDLIRSYTESLRKTSAMFRRL